MFINYEKKKEIPILHKVYFISKVSRFIKYFLLNTLCEIKIHIKLSIVTSIASTFYTSYDFSFD